MHLTLIIILLGSNRGFGGWGWADIQGVIVSIILFLQAPVSQNCPLLIHKRQKGLNKLIEAVRVVSQGDMLILYYRMPEILAGIKFGG